ncbi:MAG: carboxyl-terminal protease, partial [Verrucomicrobiales bacterium]|nr:carboxyl-terminal protease [Verrucomicrobiales bacterium]
SLDGGHVLFLQSDLKEFDKYRATLAQLTRTTGNTSIARTIFDRYLERLNQRVAYATNALQTESFDFNRHEVYSEDREKASRPEDLDRARELWGEQLRAEYLQEKLNDKKPEEITRILTRRYTQLKRTMSELTRDEVLEVYLNALAHVYDPHSDYLGHDQMDSFSIAMNLSLFGIGATLQSEDGFCKIRELVAGGPAARSGLLKPGDRIVAVAQGDQDPVDIVNMPLSHAVELIRGPKGSTVRLTLIPASAADESVHKSITLVRDEIKLEDQQAKARIVDFPTGQNQTLRLGVVDLPSFYAGMEGKHASGHRSASTDVAKLLARLKAEQVHGIILDLRRNGGGSLEEAINLTGLFIRKGPVVQTRGPNGDIEVGKDTDSRVVYDGPLIVLTSRYSASASEILAGALQDYGRAIIVGDTSTFGKGTVQTILPLAQLMDRNGLGHSYDPGALKITISKFYRPSGASTQLKGVASDIVLPSLSDLAEVSESSLKDPLPWDVVPSADYEHLDQVRPYLLELSADSSRRVAAEKGFTYLRDNMTRLKKNLEAKSVSLNEAERRKEMAEAKVRQKEYEKENLAVRASMPTTYNITLKNVELPGLPQPLPHTNSVAIASNEIAAKSRNEAEATQPADLSQDVILTEAEHILADYVQLLAHKTETSLSAR